MSLSSSATGPPPQVRQGSIVRWLLVSTCCFLRFPASQIAAEDEVDTVDNESLATWTLQLVAASAWRCLMCHM